MKFKATMPLMKGTNLKPENLVSSSLVLEYEIEILRLNPGHKVTLKATKLNGNLYLERNDKFNLSEFSLDNINALSKTEENKYCKWFVDFENKKIVLC